MYLNKIINGYRWALVFLFCFITLSVIAQNPQKNNVDSVDQQFGLAIKSKAYGDSVVLRWAPTNGVVWSVSRHKGYKLYRINYKENGSTDTILLTSKPIYPQSLEQLNKKAGNKNKYIAMAAQALYGKDFKLTEDQPTSFLDEVQQQSDAYNLRFFVAMQSADLSSEAADALGLRWVDKTAKKGFYYGYIVRSDTSTLSGKILPGLTKTINVPLLKAHVPLGLEGISEDRQIELHWNRRQLGGFSYYYVEKSDDGGKTYKRLTEEPYFSPYDPAGVKGDSMAVKAADILENSHIFIDSIKQNYVDYYYRIAGIDAFADVSAFTAPIKVHGIDKMPPAAVIVDSVVNIFQNQVLVKWKDGEKAPDLAGYFVAKGHDFQGPFEPLHEGLLSKDTKYYLDTAAMGNEKNFYVVASLDTAGNYSYSIPRMGILTDTIAPGKPTGLLGLMDKTGVVGLQWNSNPEIDVKGYKVYYSYNPDKNYLMLTNYTIVANTLIDSISPSSLNRAVYYKVVAQDLHGNLSDYSDVLKIDKPIVAPTSPVAKKIYVENGNIHVEWIGSSSEYVSEYEVFRKIKGDLVWSSLGKKTRYANDPDFEFVDSTATPGKEYIYTAESVDVSGIRSLKSFPVSMLNNNFTVLKIPGDFIVVYSEKEKSAKISWKYQEVSPDYFFIIYKAVDNGVMGMWTSKDSNERLAIDNTVKKGHTYRYTVEVRQRKGKLRSQRSKEVSVLVP